MIEHLYKVGDHVRASQVGSKLLEPAVVKEVNTERPLKTTTLNSGMDTEGPLYWIRFKISGMLVPRWQNELASEPVLETTE